MEQRYHTLDDPELIEHCKQGDSRALEQIYYRYRDSLLRFAWKCSDQYTSSANAVESIFIELAEQIEEYNAGTPLKLHLYRRLIHHCQSEEQEPEEDGNVDEEDESELDSFAPEGMWAGFSSPQQNQETSEGVQLLKEHLFEFPFELRSIFLLRYLRNFSDREIQAVLDVPDSDVRYSTSKLEEVKNELTESMDEQLEEDLSDIATYIDEWESLSPPAFPKKKETNILRAGRRMAGRLEESDYTKQYSGLITSEQDLTDLVKMIPIVFILVALVALIPYLWELMS